MEIEVRSPFPFEALPRVWGWVSSFRDRITDDFSPKTLEDFLLMKATQFERNRTWAIYGDGELGGLIEFERFSPWIGQGHFLLKPEFQRKGISIKAARVASAEVFKMGVGKVIFQHMTNNMALGSLLINLGAVREGTLKNHTLCAGKPVDMALYGLSKESFEAKLNVVTHG